MDAAPTRSVDSDRVKWRACIYKPLCTAYDGSMPKKRMKSRVIRVPDELWEAARAKADERGESLAEAIRAFLRRYVR